MIIKLSCCTCLYNYKAVQNLTYINCRIDRLLLIYQSMAVFHSPTVKIFNSVWSGPPNNQLYMPECLFYLYLLFDAFPHVNTIKRLDF